MLDHTRNTDGLGAIYPSMMYPIMALDVLGYPRDHPDRVEAIRQFERLLTETPSAFYLPALLLAGVGHRASALFALGEMGAGGARRDAPRAPTGSSRRKSAGRATGR